MKDTYPSETLELEITMFNHNGMGYAEYRHPSDQEGKLGRKLHVLVPETLPGDVVQVTVPNAKGRRRAVVDYDKILKPAHGRIGQWGPDEKRQGGTPLRFMDYQGQLAYKQGLVEGYLADHDFDTGLVEPILGMKDPYHYRNKMELTFGLDGEIGMHEVGNYKSVVDWQEAVIAPEQMLAVKQVVQSWQQDWQLSSYNKESKEGALRHLMMRQSFATGELMVALFSLLDLEEVEEAANDLRERLVQEFDDLASLLWIKNTNIADKTQSEATYVLHGRDFIYDQMNGFRYRVWFDTFFQPNPLQAEKMVELALEASGVDESTRVLDLFCGVGTFSLPFAARARELAGIEIVESSIESARRNAEENGLDNTYFIASDARHGMTQLVEDWGKPDMIMLDPPRDGAGGKVMRHIGRLDTDRVVYVSCNPKSLAKDLATLRDFGYQLKFVQPVDQFPHTHHVETVSLLVKSRVSAD